MKYRFKYTAKRALIGEKRLKEILEKFFAIKIYIAFYLVNFFFFFKTIYHIKQQLRKVKV